VEDTYRTLLEKHHFNHHSVYYDTLSPEFVPSYRWLLENEVTGGPNGTSRHFWREMDSGMPQDIKKIALLNETTKGQTDKEVVARHKKERKAMSKDDVKLCTWCQKIETKFGEWKACGRCKGPIYCSEECQRVDWKRQHRMICKP
jgi:cbb3-type cytochrome oxidase cytochrome c subunit